jgi:hypothetical protein
MLVMAKGMEDSDLLCGSHQPIGPHNWNPFGLDGVESNWTAFKNLFEGFPQLECE